MTPRDPARQPRHVASGEFRVDRARMLEKLRLFHTPAPAHFALAWIRCAVAGGATRIAARDPEDRLGRGLHGLELRFDGLPFRRAELEEPYACLFEADSPGARRNRYLALGWLSALGQPPVRASLVTGRGTERLRLESLAPGQEKLSRVEDPEDDTILTAAWDRKPGWLKDLPDLVEARGQGCPAPIDWSAAGKALRIPVPRAGGLAHRERKARAHGWTGPGPGCELQLCVDGVAAAFERFPLKATPVTGFWDDPELKLDASHDGVARDGRFQRAVEWLGEAAGKLLVQEARSHAEAMGWVRQRLAEPACLEAWRAALDQPGASFEERTPMSHASFLDRLRGGRRPAGSTLRAVWEAGRRARWLREACVAQLGAPGSPELWKTPLFFDRCGRPLSPKEITLALGRDWTALVVKKPDTAGSMGGLGFWLTSAHDRTSLLRLWPRLKLIER